MDTANRAPGLAQRTELGLGDLSVDSEKRKLPVAGWREEKSLDEISDNVAWFLECLQVSEYVQVLVCLHMHTNSPWHV